ncbi:MAG: hypothetical protein U0821_21425 [Chloroflexota bacterium]
MTLYASIVSDEGAYIDAHHHRADYVLGITPGQDDVQRALADIATLTRRTGASVDHGHAWIADEPLWPDTEMRRVLAIGGRLAISVWRAIEHDVYAAVLAKALERHISPDSARSLRGAYSLPDAGVLRNLLTEADFQDVTVTPVHLRRRTPLPEAFVLDHLAATPMAGAVAAANESVRSALVQEISEALSAYRVDDGLALPAEIHLATARR